MNESRNFLIAIILSVLIIVAWQFFYVMPQKQHNLDIAAQRAQQMAEEEKAVKQQLQAQGVAVTTENISREEVLALGNRITIHTPSLHGSISLKGARLDDITLANYKETLAKNSPEVVLLSPTETKQSYFAQFGWVDPSNSIALPDNNTLWKADGETLTPEKPVTLSWDNGKGLLFKLRLSVDKHYMFNITQSIENKGDAPVSLLPYGLLNRNWHREHKDFAILHEGPLGVMDGTLNEFRYKDLIDETRKEFKHTTGWLGITDKYWLTAIIPDPKEAYNANFTHSVRNGQDRFQTDFLGDAVTAVPGATVEIPSHFFVGAKQIGLLDEYVDTLHIPLFDRAVDFGVLYFITKPLFLALKFFHGLLGNFGLAILLLTVCVKLVMFPLANKSFTSVHHMKRLQPEITRLKELYKDNKQQMNQEVMQLYKRENINPLSGCLPLVVQIPVFFALYKVLFITIEMRHAPFYGWVKDLSAPDPTNLFNLFGLLHWTPPSLLVIGAWPLIMGVTMIMQQRFNPAPSDPTQATVMKVLPFVFIFIFASFPVGLIIYWAWNNTLSILQQWVINYKLDKQEKTAKGS